VIDEYRIIVHPGLRKQFNEFLRAAANDRSCIEARTGRAGLAAMRAIRDGREAELRCERLGFSKDHYDLRDCAEIKVQVLDERRPGGRPMGPSHRMIYREFEGTEDDPRPIRQIVAFEHRKDGKPFEVAAARLGRDSGVEALGLHELPNTTPVRGRHKDPNRPISPPRQPLPPDIAAALATSSLRLPSRAHARAPAGQPIRRSPGPPPPRIRER
jgi:hypothetical protein